MMKNGKQKLIAAIVGLGASVFIIQGVLFLIAQNRSYHFEKWPQDGQDLAITEMARYMISHNCHPQMDVFEERSERSREYLYWKENKICQSSYKFSGWVINESAAIAFFRCDLGDRLGDYAVTIYRDLNTLGGQSYCDYKYFLTLEDKGPLGNLQILK